MSAKTIAFINFKGGVGKTATVVNIAAFLAKYHDKRVLVVDLDPQCNSSLWLLNPETWKDHVSGLTKSTYQIFEDEIVGTQRFEFDRAVMRGVPFGQGLPLIAKLDLLPASVEMLHLEDRLHQNRNAQSYKYLYRALKPYHDAYDYIFLDCAPNLYSVTKAALFAADNCVVPYLPDYLSLSGFKHLAEAVEEFYDRYSGSLTGRIRPRIAAVIVSHYKQVGNVFAHAVNELELQIQQLRDRDKIHPKAVLLTPYIRYDVKVAESTSEHLPVALYAPNCNGAQDYADLAQNFITHFEETL